MKNEVCLLCNQPLNVAFSLEDFLTVKKDANKTTKTTSSICADCKTTFQNIDQNHCSQCGRQQLDDTLCEDCVRWEHQTAPLINHAAFSYTDSMHDLMRRYKRYGDYVLSGVLTELAEEKLSALIAATHYDFFVPLPTDPRHIKARGFDTITSIFEPLLPLTHVLNKLPTERAQSQKDRKERMETKQSFYYDSKQRLTGRILLLDDLYTTGRTFYHARDAVLLQNPNCQIESFSIIR